MRVTVSHTQSKEEVMRTIDRSFDEVFRNLGAIPVKLVEEKRSWEGSRLSFSMSAKMGFLSSPVKGTIDVTDRDVTVDVDLGMFERLIPAAKAQETLSGAVRGLLR